MADATELTISNERLPPTMYSIRLTTTGTTSNYVCPVFNRIESVVGNNESDNDGVGIAVSAFSANNPTTITITVGTSGDVVTLMIVGQP